MERRLSRRPPRRKEPRRARTPRPMPRPRSCRAHMPSSTRPCARRGRRSRRRRRREERRNRRTYRHGHAVRGTAVAAPGRHRPRTSRALGGRAPIDRESPRSPPRRSGTAHPPCDSPSPRSPRVAVSQRAKCPNARLRAKASRKGPDSRLARRGLRVVRCHKLRAAEASSSGRIDTADGAASHRVCASQSPPTSDRARFRVSSTAPSSALR